MIYGFWLNTFDAREFKHSDEDIMPTHSFKGMGDMRDLTAAINRVVIDLDENDLLQVDIEVFQSDEKEQA
jgi:hypothetical protein